MQNSVIPNPNLSSLRAKFSSLFLYQPLNKSSDIQDGLDGLNISCNPRMEDMHVDHDALILF